MFIYQNEIENHTKREDQKSYGNLRPYAVDMCCYLTLADCNFDAEGVPLYANPGSYSPTIIAQYALAHWNHYLKTHEELYRDIFLVQARWLLGHKVLIDENTVGWPGVFTAPNTIVGCLSASSQGLALSVLTRAYQLTGEEVFLEVARCSMRAFVLDILDGGVCAPVAESGIFFEDVAAYPATHKFSGCICALLGLYDYKACIHDESVEELIARGLSTMHILLEEFDCGFWIRTDLLHRQLASPVELLRHVELLFALATTSDCELCLKVSARWRHYLDQPLHRLRYFIAYHQARYSKLLWKHIQSKFFSVPQISYPLRVCIPITAFPVIGGTYTVLSGLVQVMQRRWEVEYLTQHLGKDVAGFTIHSFGTVRMHPWRFPMVWLYFFAGLQKLIWLLRHTEGYHLILPQDGVFTAAFAAVAGKLAGVRVVCMDHGNLTLLNSQTYREERLQTLTERHWVKRSIARLGYMGYWPSLKLLAWLTARFADHFLIPGVAGDGVEDICRQLKIPQSRITRFGSLIDTEQYGSAASSLRASVRKKNGIAEHALVVAMVCRLSPEKGLHVALESIQQALSQLSPQQSARVRFIIAGDGPLRAQVEEDIRSRGLSKHCLLWGEIVKSDVISLLNISDIFLYTSIRGACLSMAVLEAMASGCPVIASTMPLSNAHMLANGRGIAVAVEDVEQTSRALVLLLNDLKLCRTMGQLARDYTALHHSAASFRRVLQRVTRWSASDHLLAVESEGEA